MGFEPTEPYPGRVDKPWRLRCTTCGRIRPIYLRNLRSGHRCAHTRGHLTTEEAAEEFLVAGYELLGAYSGRVDRPHPARCLICGAVRHPSLNKIRKGGVCKHRPV